MPPTSAAMELKVLINILTQGQAVPNLLAQVNQLTAGLTKLQNQVGAGPVLPPIPPKAKEAEDSMKSLEASVNKVMGALKFLAGGFLALQSVRMVKDLADTAARAEVLATVLHVVGNNAGYTVEQLDKADRQIQALGITASASRQALTQFIQAQLELSKAPELARAAQDAAVILGTNSSEAFSRLVTAVQTSNTMMLRHMGIIVSSDLAYQRYAQTINKTAASLNSQERAQAFLNATLNETKRISGAYVSAMGDVGKQIQSLDRVIQTLKESLGKGLLPAYLAIVDELNIFLQHMTLVSDEIYGQGEGAKKLGEELRALARGFREAAEFLVKHHQIIEYLVFVYGLLRLAVIPAVKGIVWLGAELSAVSSGTAVGWLSSLVLGIGAATASFILFGVAIIAGQVLFDRFDAAIGSVLGSLLTLAQAFVALGNIVAETIAACIKSITQFLLHPFSENWKEPWKNWSAYVKSEIDSVAYWWDLTKARFNQALTPGGAAGLDPQTQREQARAKAFEEEAQLITQVSDKTTEYNKMLRGTDSYAATKALGELKVLKEQLRVAEETRKAQQAALGYTPVMREREAKALEGRAEQIKEERLIANVEDLRAKSAYDSTDIGKQFSKNLGDFTALLDAYQTAGNKAGITTTELARQFVEIGQQTKTKQELADLRIQLDKLSQVKGIPADVMVRARGVVANAERQVRSARLAETAQVDAERLALFRDTQKRIADGYSNELDLLRIRNDRIAEAEQEQYTIGAITMDEYHEGRMTRLKEQNALELEQAQNQLRSLEAEKPYARTPTDVAALETRRLDAEANVEKVRVQGLSKVEQERTKARGEYRAQSDKILDIDLQNAALYGGELEAVDIINQKYKDQLKDLHAKGDTYGEAVLQQAKENELLKVHAEFRQRDLDLAMQVLQVERDKLDLQQAQINVDRQRVDAAQKMGQITEAEAMRQRNALLYQQIEKDTLFLKTKEVELSQKLAFYESEKARIIKEQATASTPEHAGGFAAGSPETLARINKELGTTARDIAGIRTEIATTTGAIATATVNLELYSTKIKDAFTNQLADALAQTTLHFERAGDIWKSMADSIASEIVGIFTKRLAQLMTQKLSFAFFDKLMGLGTGGGGGLGMGSGRPSGGMFHAEGGLISGPGTGTSDSIPAMVSAGEHIMPASKTAQWLPLLEGIRLGRLSPAFALGGVVALQSIAPSPIIPRRYASGGMVVSDAGSAAVQPGGGVGHMTVSLHPDAMNMTLREWLEQEVVRQQGRR